MSCAITLKKKGLKLTPQRRLIVDIIHDTTTHLTAEDIILHAQERMPGVNKSTIYRTLDILEEAGCVVKSELSDRSVYHHAEEGHHHHLICSRCGKTIECDENIFTGVKRSIKQRYGFSGDFKHMVLNGLCEECQNRNR